jgi:hypothetical protein
LVFTSFVVSSSTAFQVDAAKLVQMVYICSAILTQHCAAIRPQTNDDTVAISISTGASGHTLAQQNASDHPAKMPSDVHNGSHGDNHIRFSSSLVSLEAESQSNFPGGLTDNAPCHKRSRKTCGAKTVANFKIRGDECFWDRKIRGNDASGKADGKCIPNCGGTDLNSNESSCTGAEEATEKFACAWDAKTGCRRVKWCTPVFDQGAPSVIRAPGESQPLQWRKRCVSGAVNGAQCSDVQCEAHLAGYGYSRWHDTWVPLTTHKTSPTCLDGRVDGVTCESWSKDLCTHLQETNRMNWLTLDSDKNNKPGFEKRDRLTFFCGMEPQADEGHPEVASIAGVQYIDIMELGGQVLHVSKIPADANPNEEKVMYYIFLGDVRKLAYDTKEATIQWYYGEDYPVSDHEQYRLRRPEDHETATEKRDLCCC